MMTQYDNTQNSTGEEEAKDGGNKWCWVVSPSVHCSEDMIAGLSAHECTKSQLSNGSRPNGAVLGANSTKTLQLLSLSVFPVEVTRLWPCEVTLKRVLLEKNCKFFNFFATLHRGGAFCVPTLYRSKIYIVVYGDLPGPAKYDVILK
jgi:hypothetical protein